MKCDIGTGLTCGLAYCIHLMSNSGSPVPPLLNYIKVYNNNDLRYRKKKTDARIYEDTSFASEHTIAPIDDLSAKRAAVTAALVEETARGGGVAGDTTDTRLRYLRRTRVILGALE